jgi:putative membrane protein
MARCMFTKFGIGLVSLAALNCGGTDTPPPQTPEPMQTGTDMAPASGQETMTPAPMPEEPAAEAVVTPPAPEPLADPQIAAVTQAANQAEVEQAKIAQKKAKHARVKKFAAMMIKHHGDAQKKQDKLAKKLTLTVEDSPALAELKSSNQSTLEKLESTNAGPDFDMAYMNAQVEAHQKVLDVIDKQLLPNAQNEELKTLITELRPVIEAHLTEAREISGLLSAPAATPTPSGQGG